MKIDLRDIFIQLKKMQDEGKKAEFDIYGMLFAYSKSNPFQKATKRIEPVRILVQAVQYGVIKFSEIEIKHMSNRDIIENLDFYVRFMPYNKKGVVQVEKKIDIYTNKYSYLQNDFSDYGVMQFFENYDKATTYWNLKIKEHERLMKENILELEKKMKEFVEKNLIK